MWFSFQISSLIAARRDCSCERMVPTLAAMTGGGRGRKRERERGRRRERKERGRRDGTREKDRSNFSDFMSAPNHTIVCCCRER